MKKLRKIISAVPVAIVVIAAAFAIYCAISVSNTGSVSFFGYRFFRIVSGSMEPEYPPGSVVICKSIDPEKLVVGDIITFTSRDPNILGRPNTHVIVKIDNTPSGLSFTTKGTANNVEDPYAVSPEDIFGRVEGKSGILSMLLSVFDRSWAYPVFIILPLLLVTAFTVKQYLNVLKAHLEERKKDDSET